ncbi:hypothetical protein GRF29_1536g305715 [Pseudopithomyces chartarum]|uniref:Uncharacterized protein n=1 Tax=Pseudopithomyces chartarum TaxID=1892770 RepID=A0AAN6LML9_9PLEO|nr:hypothetical protein GRF29_1536g305715 [Pseudopithomyces chartarum]
MSQELENALISADDNAACQSLYRLLPTGAIPRSSALPVTAKACLEAFCDHSRPVRRRRWTGLLLARLIESYPEVVPHLRRVPSDVVRIGVVILSSSEVEEIKIVAGLIIRVGLSQGFSFADFWSVEKAHASASMFPKDADTHWMQSFQDYLDALSSLVPFDTPSPQLSIMYPIALVGTGGFCWVGSEQSFPVLLMETHALTLVTPEPSLHDIQFVYVPIECIREIECQPYDAYDSQDRHDAVQPWQVILKFFPDSPSYQVNCSQHSGSDLAIVMRHDKDAQECVAEIKAILSAKKTSSDNSTSSSLAQNKIFSEAVNEKSQRRTLSRGGIIEFNRSHRTTPTASDTQQTHQSTLDAAVNETHSAPSRPKLGTLPVVKKTLRLNRPPSDPAMKYEFPHDTPSIKRSAPVKTKKSSISRTSAVASEASTSGSTNPRSDMPHKRALAYDTNDAGEGGINLCDEIHSSARTTRSTKKDSASVELNASKASRGQVSEPLRQQPSALDVPEDKQGNDSSAIRGTKRTRAKAVAYKEDSPTDEDDSTSEFSGSKRTKRPRGRPPKIAKNNDPSTSPKPKAMVNNRKARQTRASKQLPQPLEGSLLANLQSKSSTTSDHESGSSLAKDDAITIQKISTTLRKSQTTRASSVVEETVPGSEAHTLSKLLGDDERDSEQTRSRTTSKKRSSITPLPSKLRSKRAKLDDNDAEDNIEPLFVQPPPTMAPARVLQDPSSPCNSRTNGSMHAPPRPKAAIDPGMEAISPTIRRQRMGGSKKQIQERKTPVHQLGRRTFSSLSESTEILSSNSKPTPASPRAPSTAISGHADQNEVTIEQEFGEYEIEKNNPFKSGQKKVNEFTRRLEREKKKSASQELKGQQGHSQQNPIELGDSSSSSSSEARPTPKQNSATLNNHTDIIQNDGTMVHIRSPDYPARGQKVDKRMVIDSPEATTHPSMQTQPQLPEADVLPTIDTADMDDDTLVDLEEPKLFETHASPHFRSSPPPMDCSPSSHSSTSAELEPKTDPPISKSDAEETEWEASLKPYQRDLNTQLLRVSNRVIRHIVDSESAVDEIADAYAQDGERSLDLLLQGHEKESEAARKEVKKRKARIGRASEKALREIRRERDSVLRDV